MLKLKTTLPLLLLFTFFTTLSFSQEYLDKDKRFMKITAVADDASYGFKIKKPIKVGADRRAIGAYLNSLKPPNGDRMHIGDIRFNYKRKEGLNKVVLTFEKKTETITLYFLTNEFEQPKAIIGFSFKTIDDIPKVVTFPSEKIVKVTPCSQTLYSVKDLLLEEQYGKQPQPAKSPTFKGGPDKLKEYFAANPLKDESSKQMLFRVMIAFVVNCKGEAGNFKIISKGRGQLATYANQVLAIVNSMPQNWEAATAKDKKVDCLQILSFTVMEGDLSNASYR